MAIFKMIAGCFRGRRANLHDFNREESGSVVMTFSLSLLAVMTLIGAAIDYSRLVGTTAKLQAAVDGAMLAAVKAPVSTRASVANSMLQSALSGSGIAASWSTPPTLNADGSLSGQATGTVKTALLGLANISQMSTTASATVKIATVSSSTPSSVVFTLTGAYGWYWKQVDLYVHQPGASSNTLVASYFYQPVNLGYSNGRGNGTVTAQFLTGGVMVANAITTPVSLGSNYDNVFMQMTVYSDGCGPGMAPTTSQSTTTTNYNCVASGSRLQTGTNRYGQPTYTTYTKTTTPVVYSTSDPSTAHNLFIGNPEVDLPNNAVPSIFTLLPCGQTVQHAWEDTPWANPLPSTWSTQDIFFNVQAGSCAVNTSYQTTAPAITR